MVRAAFLLIAAAIGSVAGARVFRDPAQPIDKRAADIVSKLTLEEKAAQMQDSAPAIPRLGIPAYAYWNEALHGVARAGEATVFPQAIGMAASWDKELLLAEGKTIAVEARAKYNQAQREGNSGRRRERDAFPDIVRARAARDALRADRVEARVVEDAPCVIRRIGWPDEVALERAAEGLPVRRSRGGRR